MRKFSFNLYIIIAVFFVVYFSFASDIFIDDGISGYYESEKYLASQYLVTNLHLSKTKGKRPAPKPLYSTGRPGGAAQRISANFDWLA